MTEEETKPNPASDEQKSVSEIMKSFPSKDELIQEQEGVVPSEPEKEAEKTSAVSVAMDGLEKEAIGKGVVENPETNAPKRTDLEIQAMERGWSPKEDFKGKPEHWVTAREFVDRSNMLDKISHQNKEMRELKKGNEELAILLKKRISEETEAKAEKLQKLKEDAISEGEVETAFKYETEYQKAKKEIEGFKEVELIAKNKKAAEPPSPEIVEFIDRNKAWLNSNTPENHSMKEYAVAVEMDVEKQYPNWQQITKLEEVERLVKKQFSHRFERKAEIRPMVESKTANPPTDKNKILYTDLPPEAKNIVDQFCKYDRKKVISKDEYAQHLLATGAIKYE